MREIIWGRHPILEMLRHKEAIDRILVAKGSRVEGTLKEIVDLAQTNNVTVQWVPREQLDKLDTHHQGVAAQVEGYPYKELEDGLQRAAAQNEPPLILILDQIQDIHNLGSLLRTAEAVGVHAVVLPERRAAGVTPAVRKASAGAVEYLTICQIGNLQHTIQDLKHRGIWIAGVEKDPDALPYFTADLRGPLAIVIGAEGQGIRRLVREACDFLVQLPMVGHVDTLNAAVAGSIVLYEAMRQRRLAT